MPGIDKNSGPSLPAEIDLTLSRQASLNLSEQIVAAVSAAIRSGRIRPGARMPSARDFAIQLGVARGTVRAAYDMLADSQLLVAKGAAGTWVGERLLLPSTSVPQISTPSPLSGVLHDFGTPPRIFQLGVPAGDAFPGKVWSRIVSRHARRMSGRSVGYPDPRGSQHLREQLVSYLAMTRGINCQASQIIITHGFAGALGLISLAMNWCGQKIWTEDPGYLLARKALELAGMTVVGVKVDQEGIRVSEGQSLASDARLALVTPGQQAPLGMPLSPGRRGELLHWAKMSEGFIIEDDYLGELQLTGRAAPALASLDGERVLHIGTFSKNLSPALRMGYLVVPERLSGQFGDVAAALLPAASFVLQDAVAEFLREGHFMRHLRRMKRLYAQRQAKMLSALRNHFPLVYPAALAVVVEFSPGTKDVDIARKALAYGMAPTPLSRWYLHEEQCRYGLILSVTNMPEEGFESHVLTLKSLEERWG